MLSIAMPKTPAATKTPHSKIISKKSASLEAAAAELALKAHALAFDSAMLAELPNGDRTMQEIAEAVDLTEAPEDAVASLVIDLMHYCEREKIDWPEEVMVRAGKRFRAEHA
jgi:hypothetical protein